jgi:hypothetical protein
LALPIGRKRIVIEFPVQRIQCKACGLVRQVKVGFADAMSRYTRSFERYVLELSGYTTIADAADHPGISWDVVKDIQKRYLQRKFSRPKLTTSSGSPSTRSMWGKSASILPSSWIWTLVRWCLSVKAKEPMLWEHFGNS